MLVKLSISEVCLSLLLIVSRFLFQIGIEGSNDTACVPATHYHNVTYFGNLNLHLYLGCDFLLFDDFHDELRSDGMVRMIRVGVRLVFRQRTLVM